MVADCVGDDDVVSKGGLSCGRFELGGEAGPGACSLLACVDSQYMESRVLTAL